MTSALTRSTENMVLPRWDLEDVSVLCFAKLLAALVNQSQRVERLSDGFSDVNL